jgi:hypothetical protein
MKEQKEKTKKRPWRRPEIKEIGIRDTEAEPGDGGDLQVSGPS